MANEIKIKLRNGAHEIELEGSRADVDALLEKWWSKTSSGSQDNDAKDSSRNRNPTKSKYKSTKSRTSTSTSDVGFDPNALANEIKQHKNFKEIEEKIVNAKGAHFNKVALILWISEKPLTSGQIHRTLQSLNVKLNLPRVSEALKSNMSKFLTSAQRRSGGPPAEYRLTAPAISEFEKWLLKNE